ncbi:hypothetical protein O6H91_04G001400 [Diphasiastrum complanatum]|uniref:Uncharacterized protein n=1 Tax=Diphasiastrum complanatum TaxID=34168 RepID=A0ACC2DTR2_DIPCM|nr:hypothetical protein O6H91_04G001400 [Diphasiastrum complanatum]
MAILAKPSLLSSSRASPLPHLHIPSRTQASRSCQMAAVRCVANKNQEQQQAAAGAAVAAVLSILPARSANALEKRPAGEPKPGSKEALKKYANICVSQPQASICHG